MQRYSFLTEIKERVLKLNQEGLQLMKYDNFNDALSYLKEAERFILEEMQIVGSHPVLCKLLTVTINNLACYYRKKGHVRSALRYFVQVLSIEKFYLKDTHSMAYSYLNVSTLLSELKKHEEALKFAKRSLLLFSEQYSLQNKENLQNNSNKTPEQKEEHNFLKSMLGAMINVATLCLKTERFAEAIEVSTNGINKAKENLGPNHLLESRLAEVRFLSQQKLQDQITNPRRLPSSKTQTQNPRMKLFELSSKSFVTAGPSNLSFTSRRDKNTSEYDRYMRPQSAYCWEMPIGERNGIKLNIDRVRGEVSLGNVLKSKNHTSRSKRPSKTSINETEVSREKPRAESKKPFEYPPVKQPEQKVCERTLPFKLRSSSTEPRKRSLSIVTRQKSEVHDLNTQINQKPISFTKQPPAQKNIKDSTKTPKMEKPYDLFDSDNQIEFKELKKSQKVVTQEPEKKKSQKSLIFDSSFESVTAKNKHLYPIDEQSNEEMKSRDFVVKDIQVDEIPQTSKRTSYYNSTYKT